MRIRPGLGLLICCCAGLAACTAAAGNRPDTTVTTPAIGRPPAPASAQAALSSEAFTPYAGLGAVSNDGLAPEDTYDNLHTACMNDAGYGQYADIVPVSFRANNGLTMAVPFGWQGYLGAAEAAQYGFMIPGLGGPLALSGPDNLPASAPAGLQTAAGKCLNIVMNFNNGQWATSMAGIETMNDVISDDVVHDPSLKNATKAWSACMARNGYTAPDAQTLANQELQTIGLRPAPGSPAPGSGLTAAQNQAQIAMAVADADCTQSTDLAGIYFAVQASYEQQIVTANQQALNAAVRQFKANYAKELRKLPALLRSASSTVLTGPPGGKRRPSRS
jgi:hypothetical protein